MTHLPSILLRPSRSEVSVETFEASECRWGFFVLGDSFKVSVSFLVSGEPESVADRETLAACTSGCDRFGKEPRVRRERGGE